jgi:topoisomerase-4 subunit A
MVDIEGEGNIVALLPAGPRDRSCCSPRRTAAASSPRPPARSPRPARASRSSICARRALAWSGRSAGDDYVAVIGENRKMVVFPLKELPEMGRGQGVQLQRYRDGGLADATSFPSPRG